MTTQELQDYLAPSHIAVIVTLYQDGRPHVTPNWYHYDGTALTFITRTDRLKYRHLQRDPRVSICVYDPPAASNYVVITGNATCTTQDIWEDARRIIARYVAPEHVEGYVARWQTEPRVLVRVVPEHIATRSSGMRHLPGR